MRKIWLLPFLILLAACASGGGAPTEGQNTESEPEGQANLDDSPTESAPVESAPAGNLNNDITISSNPADAGNIRERDWTKGADDPLVTIVEYGDFQ